MQLVVKRVEEDDEIELGRLEEALHEFEYGTLPKDFWITEEWNAILEEKWRVKKRIEVIKKKLSEESVEYN